MSKASYKGLDDPLAKVIVPIVEGQIRSFLHAHPQISEAVDWRHSHATKEDALVSSLAKRLSRDLLCKDTRDRIEAVVLNNQHPASVSGEAVPPLMDVE